VTAASRSNADIERAADRITSAGTVVVLTGAGITAESGLPTFRAARTGLWARYDPLQLATPEAFAADPDLVWRWYAWRRSLAADAQPNAGHFGLAALARLHAGITLVTQNVDGLQQRAGSAHVIEFHGNLMRTLCSRERRTLTLEDPRTPVLPRCPFCDAPARPDVVWFGEAIPDAAIRSASTAASHCEVFMSIGTSSLVYPAAGLAETALRRNAFVIEVNPDATPLTPLADLALRDSASLALPALVEAVKRRQREGDSCR
jgi:NAD-dependent deacetylase